MIQGVSRARANPLSTGIVLQVHPGAVSVGTRRLNYTQLPLSWVTREAAKPKLVVYILDIELASVATS